MIGVNEQERYQQAQLNFAVQGVAAMAGSMRRAGSLDKEGEEAIAGLLNQLRHAAQMTRHADPLDAWHKVAALYSG